MKNILAKIDAQKAGAHEAIMLNAAGFIAECTADNLFVVRDGGLLTPSTGDGALGGITRGAILELAAEANIPATEERLTRYDVYAADECFHERRRGRWSQHRLVNLDTISVVRRLSPHHAVRT
jgi:branched-chain amino acid aminotransferase